MFNKCPVYPILPTSESSTLTFMQKLDMLEYNLEKLKDYVDTLSDAIDQKSTVTATGDNNVLETITIDGDTYTMPEGSDVEISESNGYLGSVRVGDTTLNVKPVNGVGTDQNVLTSIGIGTDIFTIPNADSVTGTTPITDASQESGMIFYQRTKDVLTCRFSGLDDLTGTTYTTGNIFELTETFTAECPFAVSYSTAPQDITTVLGTLKIVKGSGTQFATVSFGAGEYVHVIEETILTKRAANVSDFKKLAGFTFTFLLK